MSENYSTTFGWQALYEAYYPSNSVLKISFGRVKITHSKSRGSVWRKICQNISLYESEQSLSLSQDEGEQC